MVNLEYGKYKNIRNTSWQCLLDYGIDSLPVKINNIIMKSPSIRLFKDSDVKQLHHGQSGMTVFRNNVFNIAYRDTENKERCRFTIAHELGHILLGHMLIDNTRYRTFGKYDKEEQAADMFAIRLLAPACVLHEIRALTAEQIAKVCNISITSASHRAERMAVLEKRNKWYSHPLERQVRKQFENFIEKHR